MILVLVLALVLVLGQARRSSTSSRLISALTTLAGCRSLGRSTLLVAHVRPAQAQAVNALGKQVVHAGATALIA
jgi:hypothetical protein